MTSRNFKKELNYYVYNDPEYGEDIEHICHPSLICIITELCDRIEKLEERLEDISPSVNDTYGPTGLIGDPQ
jgi:hypothetical protein